MRKILLPITLTLCSLAITGFAQPPQSGFTPFDILWQRFSDDSGRFKVLLPGTPRESVTTVETRFGNVERHHFMLRVGLASYVITYADLPASLIAASDIKQFLAATRDEEVTGLKAKILNEGDSALAGRPAREFSAVSADVSLRMRICLIERRLYQLSVIIPFTGLLPDPGKAKPSLDSPQVLKNLQEILTTDFFNSFKLLPIPPAPDAARPPAKKIPVSGGVLQGSAIKRITPLYPPLAKAARMSGVARVEIIFSEEGRIIEAEVVSSPPFLWEAALDAAKQWVFRPTELSGVPVKVQGILSFNFTLQ